MIANFHHFHSSSHPTHQVTTLSGGGGCRWKDEKKFSFSPPNNSIMRVFFCIAASSFTAASASTAIVGDWQNIVMIWLMDWLLLLLLLRDRRRWMEKIWEKFRIGGDANTATGNPISATQFQVHPVYTTRMNDLDYCRCRTDDDATTDGGPSATLASIHDGWLSL